MDKRLAQLEAELAEAEVALADLEYDIDSKRSPTRLSASASAAPKESEGGGGGAGASSSLNPKDVALQPADDSRNPESSRTTNFVHVRLETPQAPNSRIRLGMAFRRGDEGTHIVVADVLDDSPAAAWNHSCQQRGEPEKQVQIGDIVVEVNGVWVQSANDLERGLQTKVAKSTGVNLRLMRCRRPRSVSPSRDRGSSRGRDALEHAGRQEDTDIPLGEKSLETDDAKSMRLTRMHLPGRYSRASPPRQRPSILPLPQPSSLENNDVPEGRSRAGANIKRGTFATEARFPEVRRDEAESGLEPLVFNDHFLSTKPSPLSAVISPLTPVKVRRLGKDRSNLARGMEGSSTAANDLSGAEDDEVSTNVSSELPGDIENRSLWSTDSTETWHSLPGPGDYAPNYASVSMSLSKGVPSFARYVGRSLCKKKLQKKAASVENEEKPPLEGAEDSSDAVRSSCTASTATTDYRSTEAANATSKARGGFIAPLPQHVPRGHTEASSAALFASRRPFYDTTMPSEPHVPEAKFATAPATGRLEKPTPIGVLGPGCYEVTGPSLGDSNAPAAFIGPGFVGEETIDSCHDAAAVKTPGPADYEVMEGMKATCPRSQSASFGKGAPLPHDQAIEAPTNDMVSPRWEIVRPRIRSALLGAEPPTVPAVPPQRSPGPGAYSIDSWLTRRIRSGVRILSWVLPSSGWHSMDNSYEHARGLYTSRPVDSSIRGDPRALAGTEADLALRRGKFHAFMRYHSEPPVRLDRRWRFYDLGGSPEPPGLAEFAQRMSFEDFQEWHKRFLRRQDLALRRLLPNLHLPHYSLPSMDTTHARAPGQMNFGLMTSRSCGEEDMESPRQGDVLLLSSDAEKGLLHPRTPCGVDMAKQQGRATSAPPDLCMDDAEELALSPRPVRNRTPVFVDMAKEGTQPEERMLSANVWAASEDGPVYTYKATSGLRLKDEEVDDHLDLDAAHAENRLLPSVQQGDFGAPLGRPDHDPRAPGSSNIDEPQEQLLLLDLRPPLDRALQAGPEGSEGAEVRGD